MAAGKAFSEIWSSRLFRHYGYRSFRDYVDANQGRLGFSSKTAERCARSYELVQHLPSGGPMPCSWSHIYPLHKLQIAMVPECWDSILQLAQGDPKAVKPEHVKLMVDRFQGPLSTSHNNTLVNCTLSGIASTSPAVKCSWYTPEYLLKEVRSLFGGEISLDPCSSYEAQQYVRAKAFISAHEDGLDKGNSWSGKVFINPPYGKTHGNKSLQGLFLQRAQEEVRLGNVSDCLLLLKCSVGAMWFHDVFSLPHCFLKERVVFCEETQNLPAPWGSVIVYIGPNTDRFVHVFGHLGHIPGSNAWCYAKPS